MKRTSPQTTATAITEIPTTVSFFKLETSGALGLAKTEMRSKINNWLLVGVLPSSYACKWEVGKQERGVSVAQSDSRMRLCVLCS